MNNEIKEIINDLRKTADNSIFVVCSSQEELDKIPKYTANFLSVNDRQAKILLDYITNLQEKVEQYENPDDYTLFYMWLDEKAKDKIKKLQEENKELEEDKSKMFETAVKRNNQLLDRIDKAVEYVKSNEFIGKIRLSSENKQSINKLLDILQGSDKE